MNIDRFLCRRCCVARGWGEDDRHAWQGTDAANSGSDSGSGSDSDSDSAILMIILSRND